jgi:FKBP-type peptidyl-prolyl cis-trans isomerase
MTAGSEREIVVPPQQAYGSRGYGNVGPNVVVMYGVQIVDAN